MNGGRLGRLALVAALLAALLGGQAGATAAEAPATVEELIRLARRMSPDIAAMALEAEAAAARADAAGALDDPKVQLELEDMRNQPGYLPRGEFSTRILWVRQMLPFWGKRGLAQRIARSESQRVQADRLATENDVVFRVKEAYAQYHRAHVGADLTEGLVDLLSQLGNLVQARYAQGLGKQQEVTSVEAERAQLTADLASIEARRRKAQARINALLARPAGTRLVEQPAPRPMPPAHQLSLADLTERAWREHPAIRGQQARIDAADRARDLAQLNFYPDVELGVGAVQRDGRLEEYRAMIEINIPLQLDRRRAERRESMAMAAAARSKLEQVRLDVAAELEEAYWDLVTLARRQRILRDSVIVQAQIAFDAALRGYELGREEIGLVLLAEQALKRATIELLDTTYEEQITLAMIERLIGGELI